MKKVLAGILATVIVAVCTSCVSQTDNPGDTQHSSTTTSTQSQEKQNATTTTTHKHEYIGKITQQATCTREGIETFTCKTCGDSYTKKQTAYGHDWLAATCERPKTCNECGKTEGKAIDHNYYNGKCTQCAATQELLILPSTPISISFLINGNESTRFDLTSISYQVSSIESNYCDLVVYFSGEKTFDYKGERANNYCAYAYKLYDWNGNLVREGDNIADYLKVGQRFIDKEITFYDLPATGTYRLEMVSFDYEYHIDF